MENFVYFGQCSFGGPIKIGHSIRPEHRLGYWATQVPFEIVEISRLPGGVFRERFLHCWFREYQIKNEWYEPCAELWHWAMQARARSRILLLPDEPHTNTISTRSLLNRIDYLELDLDEIAELAGTTSSTVRQELKKPVTVRMSLVAAIAVLFVRENEYWSWETSDLASFKELVMAKRTRQHEVFAP